jgi:MFS superfamily sulfate permease-like transporter
MSNPTGPASDEHFADRLKLFLNPFGDGRYEDMRSGWKRVVFRDFTAGLIVAMVAIPLAMGFAIASGLNPVHGIVGGALAGFTGALFGGSKFQVYGPTAAYIPIIVGIMATYGSYSMPAIPKIDENAPHYSETMQLTLEQYRQQDEKYASEVVGDPVFAKYSQLSIAEYASQRQAKYAEGYGMLIFCSVCAGVILAAMGLFKLGTFVAKVPHSIVVGFTIGIALTIALTQIGDVLGLKVKLPYPLIEKVQLIAANIGQFNILAVLMAVGTFLVTKYLLKISVYIPGPLIAIGAGYALTQTVLHDQGLTVASDKYGPIPTDDFFTFTAPIVPEFSAVMLFNVVFYVVAIVFVAAIESLLCSRMADRMAENTGTPYNPNKELFGQGMVNMVVPLLNGFPHTGALARTATNIKVGGMTPLAGILKCWLKLAMAFFLAVYLDLVPMACIAGILAYVAFNMVKWQEIRIVHEMNRFHIFLMYFTAAVVLLKDFLTGVLSALIIYAVLHRFLDKPQVAVDDTDKED